ncbi:unnamed protein product [Thelazia callipaeda]|uniref:Condensin-2 complex subunit H2 n=1 Tax=Thelazia callipaeda TaxID=103827 RepID=A0A0N5CRE4_THECL|nr:unnamed protein product [Thelazia callipaeda]
MADDDDLSSKYAFLLQPVRDLQKNWEIDISHLLDEFTEQLRLCEIRLDSGKEESGSHKKFSFAEAAMLIQGSTMVYSKKVEYVYGLARNFYEQLCSKKTLRKKNTEDVNENMDVVGNDSDDEPQVFDDPCELIPVTKLLRTNDWNTLMLKTEQKPPLLLPMIPPSLMPLADYEKSNVPLYSSRNNKELVGKKDDFIINTGFIHKSGVLLLDLANERLLNEFLSQNPNRNNSSCDKGYALMEESKTQNVDGNGSVHTCMSEVEKGRRITFSTNPNTTTHRDTTHADLVSDVPELHTMELDDMKTCLSRNDESSEIDFGGQDFDYSHDVKDRHPADEENFVGADNCEPVMDLFQLQDYKYAPYRACKPSFSMERRQKRNLERKEKLSLKSLSNFNYFLQQNVYHSIPKNNRLVDDVFATVFGIYMRRIERRRMNEIRSRILQKKEEPATDIPVCHDQNAHNITAKDYSSDESQGPSDIDEDENLTFGKIQDHEIDNQISMTSLYMNYDDPVTNLKSAENMTYQDMLKVHLNKYWSSAEEATSELCKRVQQWEEKIQPLLEEEESRRKFDIHEYGSELLSQYVNIGEKKCFFELVKDASAQYDISRYYLASLMLANTGNIELNTTLSNEDDGQRDVALKLLKKKRHHEQFLDTSV